MLGAKDPTLVVAAYQRGQCDDELIIVTNTNFLFKLQARYVATFSFVVLLNWTKCQRMQGADHIR